MDVVHHHQQQQRTKFVVERARESARVKPAGKCVRERERERKRISRYVSNLTKMNATWGKKQMIYEHLHLLPLEQHSLSPI